MKITSVFLIIAFFMSLCTQEVVSYSVDDSEGMVYLLTLNVCASSHGALSQHTDTPCVRERVFWFEPHTPISRYLTPASVRYNFLLASEKDHPPQFPV